MKISFRYEKNKGFITDTEGKEPLLIKGPDSPDTLPAPTELLLYGMSACSSLDVFSILEKMRRTVSKFRIEMDAEREENHPKVVKTANIHYIMDGDMTPDQVLRAINLSLERYCNVSILARRGGVHLTYSLTLNGEKIADRKEPEEVGN